MTNESFDMEEIQEQYEDAALTLLVNHIMQKEGEQFIAKNEELLEDLSFSYPADLDERMARTIDRHFTALRRRKAFTAIKKTVSHVSMVFLVVFLIFSITFINVSAFRDATMSLAMKTFGNRMAFVGNDFAVHDSISSPVPKWLPEGEWDISFYASDSNAIVTKYIRSDGSIISIYKYSLSSYVSSIDIENAELIYDVLVKGNSSVISIKDDCIILSWGDEEHTSFWEITICGSPELINTDVVVRIAESLV